MHIVAVGLNYKTTPVELRECFAMEEERLPEALKMMKQSCSILEGVVVATCNRTEIYAVVDQHQVCTNDIQSFMADWFHVPVDKFKEHLYMHTDMNAVEHLFRVTTGLDSMVLGETQILGQVKDAFLTAQQHGATGTMFNELFKEAVTLAKRAQSETAISENAVSVSYAAVELGKRIFGSFENKKTLIVGAGKMSELTLKHMQASGSSYIYVANRTLERAQTLAASVNGIALTLEQMDQVLSDVDIVISSTGSNGYVVMKEQIQEAMKKRRTRPMFLIDIAVPRDLDPHINELDNVFLYDIDDLQGIVAGNLALRQQEAQKIERMIEEEMTTFEHWYQTLEVVPIIRALQQKATDIHAETLESLFNKLPDLDERERKIIHKLTKSIVNQLLHDPIAHVKDMAQERRGKEAMDLFTSMFALEEPLATLEHDKIKAQDAAAGQSAGSNASSALNRLRAITRI
jgi:glutamyl-tRNA reductase